MWYKPLYPNMFVRHIVNIQKMDSDENTVNFHLSFEEDEKTNQEERDDLENNVETTIKDTK